MLLAHDLTLFVSRLDLDGELCSALVSNGLAPDDLALARDVSQQDLANENSNDLGLDAQSRLALEKAGAALENLLANPELLPLPALAELRELLPATDLRSSLPGAPVLPE